MDAETYKRYQTTFIAQLADYGTGENPRKEIKSLIDSISAVTNTFGFESKEIIRMAEENPKAKANLIQLSYEWVNFWDKAPDYYTDGRNEYSTKMCKLIASTLREKYGFVTETETFKGLDNEIPRLHRTLTQTATNLFIKVLSENDKAIKELFVREYGVKSPTLPMI